MKRYKFLSAALLGALLTMGTVTSCSDSGYLDINYNPNYPSTASYKQLLPAAEGSIVAVSGLYQQITGDFWCQYVTQGNSTNIRFYSSCYYGLAEYICQQFGRFKAGFGFC